MEPEGEEQHWRQFQGTELGGLLSKIYGNESKPQITYPKFKTKPRKPSEPFLPCGSKVDATDPRKSTRRDVKIDVPKLSKKAQSVALVDCIPHRRSESLSRAEIAEINMRQAHYRPAHIKAVSTDSEKDRLNQICSYKGGKGLPTELTQPVGEAPYELEAKRKEQERLEKVRAKYRKGGTEVQTKPKPLSVTEQLMNQITEEITERCDHLRHLQEEGGNARKIEVLKGEISQRVAELKRLEAKS